MDKQTDDPSLIFIHDDFQQQDFKDRRPPSYILDKHSWF